MAKSEEKIRRQVLARDRWVCAVCSKGAGGVHHIVPRARFGKRGQNLLWDVRNMITLCIRCHDDMAHTVGKRAEHLRLLRRRFGYDYSDPTWAWYLEGEDG